MNNNKKKLFNIYQKSELDNYIFTRAEIYKVATKIIKYLHERNIVHRDIRVPNIIINEEDVYLIDFGLVRIIN
ncbi:bifunctional UGMP family protein/serine/threonine protein kinase [Clostridium saccharobutylicum]|uniref:protein kinase domain-containing protein n=1 Tax=Clostridium saccharobutylicum TaxID=169679 RepID=UPI000983AF0C|nr:bifunctional UGMP family protein/serine/threonine protein kinase [Clostridium saccharobutylicum]NSB88078.1 serine/threonine-protein kinase [Clostridium saccharobutylicum]NYC27974.1 serine/threonine-protein kinase [Clostridium saccharobutylicum]OOM15259.1 bifunctional UGMP family protein/serine/threonine protein kinase [Clostridium saccharobutylicum]